VRAFNFANMAEALGSRNVTTSTTNEATINTAASAVESPGNVSSRASSTIAAAMDLRLCDYAKMRKVRTGTQKIKRTVNDKKLQVLSYVCTRFSIIY